MASVNVHLWTPLPLIAIVPDVFSVVPSIAVTLKLPSDIVLYSDVEPLATDP